MKNASRFRFAAPQASCNKLSNRAVALMVCTPSAEDFRAYAHQALSVAVNSHLLCDLRDASLGHLRLQVT